MAVLLFLLAIAGGVLVGDLVLENTAAGGVTVLDLSFTGYSQGQPLAVVAALGFMVGVLAVGSVSLRRARRVRRRELRRARTRPDRRGGRARAREQPPAGRIGASGPVTAASGWSCHAGRFVPGLDDARG